MTWEAPDVLSKIAEQYPQLVPLLSKPGIWDIVVRAVQEEWSQQRMESALQQTPYYQQTPQSRREWDVQRVLDPASAKQKIDKYDRMIKDAMQQTGIKLDGAFESDVWKWMSSPYFDFLNQAIGEGWDESEIKYQILGGYRGLQGEIGGELASQTGRVKKMADDFAVPLSEMAARGWGSMLTSGKVDEEAVRGYMIEQAKSLFPGLTDALDRGISVRQYAAPYLQIAQQELGVNPDTVSFLDPKWMNPLNQIDPKTGARVSMSLSDWVATVRSDQQYGYDKTLRAQEEGSGLAANLAKMFGATG